MRTIGLLATFLLAGCNLTSAPEDRAPTVVTLGDSVPAGTACLCRPFPNLYARAQHTVDVNLAEPGDTSADVLAQVPAVRAALLRADEVVLMVGANDMAEAFRGATSVAAAAATVRTNVTATITAIEGIRPVSVIVLGYWSVVQDGQVAAKAYGPDRLRAAAGATEQANNALRDAAEATGATYVSTVNAFHGLGGEQDPTGLLAPDGDHPNAAGHAAIAALIPPLNRLAQPHPIRSRV